MLHRTKGPSQTVRRLLVKARGVFALPPLPPTPPVNRAAPAARAPRPDDRWGAGGRPNHIAPLYVPPPGRATYADYARHTAPWKDPHPDTPPWAWPDDD